MASVISLAPIVAGGRSSVLSGRANGAYARKALGLEDLEALGERIVIEVPDKITEMTPSFVLGMFSLTLRHMAGGSHEFAKLKDEFFSLYAFTGAESIVGDVEGGIADFVDIERSLSGFETL